MQIVIYLCDSLINDKLYKGTPLIMDEERLQALEAKCQYLEGRIDTLERLFMNQQQPQGALSQVRDQLDRDRREDHVWILSLIHI